MRRARVAINGEWEVGDVGRPSSGRVTAKPVSLVGRFLEKLRVTRGSFVVVVVGGGPPVGIPGGFEVEKPWPRSTTLSRGVGEQPLGCCPGGVVEGMRSSCGGDY